MELVSPGSTSPVLRLPGNTALAHARTKATCGFTSRGYAARACCLSSSGKPCGSLLDPLYLELSAVLVTVQALEKVSMLDNTLVFTKLK
eukprot:1425266-Amphidinium_carterae.1